MPSQSRRQYLTVEVKPDHAVSRKADTTPTSPGPSPKSVRFATTEKVQPRALSTTEAWSLYHFEIHARQCRDCFNPLEVHLERRRLCDAGHSLARDVAEHVFIQDGVVYAKKKDNHKLVRIEMPQDYFHIVQLLKTTARCSAPRPAPMVSYPVPTLWAFPEGREYYEDERTRGVVEPASSSSRPLREASKHKSKHYSAVVTQEAIEAAAPLPLRSERRRTVYYDGVQRERVEAYEVEVREPERKESRRRERPKSGFWV
ncbi:hypothetical protein LTR08_002097 [Meristemomyces frigidus]|nr:hypothetical protein LTR08_002097 [Meristemomyces frigidus]